MCLANSFVEDICDFIPANLSISDVAGISELQLLVCKASAKVFGGVLMLSQPRYYIRSALPFGSPVNTNFHLLRMVRKHGKQVE